MNLPNKLTLLRVALVPVMIFFLLTDVVRHGFLFALLVFVIASLTDMLDGRIARRRGLVTDFGKLMDPLADKVLIASALICLIKLDAAPCIVVIIVIFREFLVTSLRMIAVEKGRVIAADIWGKAKTVFQIFTIIWTLCCLEAQAVGIMPAVFPWRTVTTVLMWIMAALTVVSGANYVISNRSLIEKI